MYKTDNWINKSEGMLCSTCMYYVAKGIVNGRCRRHAPTMSGWPVMFATDWCGDHKLEIVDNEPVTVPTVDGFNPGEIRWEPRV